MRAVFLTTLFLLLFGLTACGFVPELSDPGVASTFVAQNPSIAGTGVLLDGGTQFLANFSVTRSLTITTGTTNSIWINCTNNVSSVIYQVSHDGFSWFNGSNVECFDNLTVLTPVLPAASFIRFFVDGGNATDGVLTNLSITVVEK